MKEKVTIEELLKDEKVCGGEVEEYLLNCMEIYNKIISIGRWNTCIEYVVKEIETSKYYKFYKVVGNTEYQDGEDFDKYSVIEVTPIKIIKEVIEYREVK